MPIVELQDGLAQAVLILCVFGALALFWGCVWGVLAMGTTRRFYGHLVFWASFAGLALVLALMLVIEVRR
jgi:hypothetical protein